jgi:hypothetical protein
MDASCPHEGIAGTGDKGRGLTRACGGIRKAAAQQQKEPKDEPVPTHHLSSDRTCLNPIESESQVPSHGKVVIPRRGF